MLASITIKNYKSIVDLTLELVRFTFLLARMVEARATS